jgi:hypothetical protein
MNPNTRATSSKRKQSDCMLPDSGKQDTLDRGKQVSPMLSPTLLCGKVPEERAAGKTGSAAGKTGSAAGVTGPSVLDEIMFREPGISLAEEAALFHSIPRRERNPTQAEIDSDDAYWDEHWDPYMEDDEEYNREWDEYYELKDAADKQLQPQGTAQAPKPQAPKPQGDRQQRKQAKGSDGGKQRKEVMASLMFLM